MLRDYQARLSVDLELVSEAVTIARRRCILNDVRGATAVLSHANDICSRAICGLKIIKSKTEKREDSQINKLIHEFMTIGYSVIIGKCTLLGRLGDHVDARDYLRVIAAELCVLNGLDPRILTEDLPREDFQSGEEFRGLLVQTLCLLALETEHTDPTEDTGHLYSLAVQLADTHWTEKAQKLLKQFKVRKDRQSRTKTDREKRGKPADLARPLVANVHEIKESEIQSGLHGRKDERRVDSADNFRTLAKLPKHLIAHVVRQEVISVFRGNLDLAYGMLSRGEVSERELLWTLQALHIDWEALTGTSNFSEIFRAFDIDRKGTLDVHDILLYMPKHKEEEIRKLADKYLRMRECNGPAWDPQAGLSNLLSQSSSVSDSHFESLLKTFWRAQDAHMDWKLYLDDLQKQIRTDTSSFLTSNLKDKVNNQAHHAEFTDGNARLTKQCKKIMGDLRMLMKTRLQLGELNKQLRMEQEEGDVFSGAMRVLARENKREVKKDDVDPENDEIARRHHLADLHELFRGTFVDDILKKRKQRQLERKLEKEALRRIEKEQLEREYLLL